MTPEQRRSIFAGFTQSLIIGGFAVGMAGWLGYGLLWVWLAMGGA